MLQLLEYTKQPTMRIQDKRILEENCRFCKFYSKSIYVDTQVTYVWYTYKTLLLAVSHEFCLRLYMLRSRQSIRISNNRQYKLGQNNYIRFSWCFYLLIDNFVNNRDSRVSCASNTFLTSLNRYQAELKEFVIFTKVLSQKCLYK